MAVHRDTPRAAHQTFTVAHSRSSLTPWRSLGFQLGVSLDAFRGDMRAATGTRPHGGEGKASDSCGVYPYLCVPGPSARRRVATRLRLRPPPSEPLFTESATITSRVVRATPVQASAATRRRAFTSRWPQSSSNRCRKRLERGRGLRRNGCDAEVRSSRSAANLHRASRPRVRDFDLSFAAWWVSASPTLALCSIRALYLPS